MMKYLFSALIGVSAISVSLYMVLPTSPKSKAVSTVKMVNGVVMAVCLVLLGVVGMIALGYEMFPDGFAGDNAGGLFYPYPPYVFVH